MLTGRPGRPPGLERGHFVRPTVFGHVRNDMTIASEEFGGFGFETYLEPKAIPSYD